MSCRLRNSAVGYVTESEFIISAARIHLYLHFYVKKNTETLSDASKEVGLEVNAEKTKYDMSMSRHQNAGQNHGIKIANRSVENVAHLIYFGTAVTNQNLIQEKIKRRLNLGTACCHSVQNVLSSRLLSKDVKIRIQKTIILPVVLYGCETWPLILRAEHGLRVLENRALRRIFGQKSDTVRRGWRKLRNEELHNLYLSPTIMRMMNSRRMMGRAYSRHGDEEEYV
jgi:hypothetical protein